MVFNLGCVIVGLIAVSSVYCTADRNNKTWYELVQYHWIPAYF